MHLITILRDHLGLTQQELASRAGITQCDLCEMETKEPYGQITKYQRVSAALGVPVHALVFNDCTGVPERFFETHEHAEYLEETCRPGREGEEAAFRLEQERLALSCPVLARLVIPYFKIRRTSPGYDILSFDDSGHPVFIEVKTTRFGEEKDFRLTVREFAAASRLTAEGETYLIYRYTDWGKQSRRLHVIPFRAMLDGGRITQGPYICSMTDRPVTQSGISYWRRRRGLTQKEMAGKLGMEQQHLCRYETGARKCPVGLYRRIAELLEVTIDDLLTFYPMEGPADGK